jgi:hypothetical protein
VDGAYVDRSAEGFEGFCGFGVEGGFVGSEGYAAFSVGLLIEIGWYGGTGTNAASLMGSNPALLYVCRREKWSPEFFNSSHRCCDSSRVLGSHSAYSFCTFCELA